MRLDQYLVHHQFVKTRSQATDLIKRKLVTVNDQMQTKPGFDIKEDVTVKVLEEIHFVSRAGHKLLNFLLDFNISVHDKIIIDIGSSTGGFTDCVIRYGAKAVYCYDVGSHQMDEELKKDSRIHLFEETNVLNVELPFADLILIDVSFTSIKPILNHIKKSNCDIIGLIKPQFEAGKMFFKQGVLKDQKMIRHILHDVLNEALALGFGLKGLAKADLKGKKGNQEYFLWLSKDGHMDVKTLLEELC